MKYIGDFAPGTAAVVCRFNTHKADGTPITLAGSPVVSVYKNSTTQSTTGVTLTVDYDSVTGFHHVLIDTSADGTFYAAGNDFDIVVTTGTVDSISVAGSVVGTFSLNNRSALRPTTSGRTLDVSAGGEAGIDWANIGSPTTSVALSGTTVSSSQVAASVTGAVGSVTGNVGGNVVGAVGSVTGNIGGNLSGNVSGNVSGSVGSVTGAVGSVTGSVGSVIGGVGGSVASVSGSVGSVTGNVGGDVGGKVLGGGSGTISGDGVRAASVTGAVGSVTGSVGSVVGLTAAHIALIKAVTDKIDTGLVVDGPVWQFTANMLELGPSGSGGGGDATLAKQVEILAAIDTYVSSALATVNGTQDTIVGFPDSLTVGDSYTEDSGNAIHVFIRDGNDDPISSVGSHDFTDTDFAPELVITNSGNAGRVRATVTYIDPGSSEPYLKVEIPLAESRRAAPGSATMQCVLKWNGCAKTLATQSVTWVARI